MIDSDVGYGNIVGYWSLATSGKCKPTGKAAAEMKAIAETALGNAKAAGHTETLPTTTVVLPDGPAPTQATTLPPAGRTVAPTRIHGRCDVDQVRVE